jgi:hypothetical protein
MTYMAIVSWMAPSISKLKDNKMKISRNTINTIKVNDTMKTASQFNNKGFIVVPVTKRNYNQLVRRSDVHSITIIANANGIARKIAFAK